MNHAPINRAELAQIDERLQSHEDRIMVRLIAATFTALYLIGNLMLWWQV